MRFAAFSPFVCVIYYFAKENRLKRKFHTQKSYILNARTCGTIFVLYIVMVFFFFFMIFWVSAGNRLAVMRACFFGIIFVVYLLFH